MVGHTSFSDAFVVVGPRQTFDAFDMTASSSFLPQARQPKRRNRRDHSRMSNWWRKYNAYLVSAKWSAVRLRLFAQRGAFCEQCRASANLEIHHLTYDREFHERDTDLRILCRTCHETAHVALARKAGKASARKRWGTK